MQLSDVVDSNLILGEGLEEDVESGGGGGGVEDEPVGRREGVFKWGVFVRKE